MLIAPGRLAQAAAEPPDSLAAKAAAGGQAAPPVGEGALPVLQLEDGESRYLSRVLRYGPGDRFAVVDGGGQLWSAELLDRSSARLEQPLSAPLLIAPLPSPVLELAVAVPRRDFDTVLRMGCELGVDRLQPLLAERTVQGVETGAQGRRERWQAIVREACEQCERLWLPQLLEPMAAAAWLQNPTALASDAANSEHGQSRWLATTRAAGLPLLGELLGAGAPGAGAELRGCQAAAPVAARWGALARLAIGPEGGWTPAEEQVAAEAGWQPVSLGPTILRTSTAAVAGLSLLSAWRAGSCGGEIDR
ncbi:16S rRNA (uracil(1498)-N(3))-methyltransferase [Synechococcus sp. ATX 2A4]|nr:16S rRNA (uracil(1498)-N(3))-methyltransferase [Synechococcus sp. ATX 2A4]